MKRMALVCLLSALALPITSPAVDISRATELQDKEEIESALKLAKSIDEISRNVRSCSDQGVSHEKCLCQNKRKRSTNHVDTHGHTCAMQLAILAAASITNLSDSASCPSRANSTSHDWH